MANKEREALEEYVKEEGIELEGGIQPHDWRYVAEKVRVSKYDFDETLLKPYLSLDSVRNAMFAVSNKLFGLQYIPRPDLKLYQQDVEAYEVRDANDQLVSVFLHDNFSRQHKSSGAWMSEYRSQTKNLPTTTNTDEPADPMEGIPIVSNNNNFAKAGSTATLLSYDGVLQQPQQKQCITVVLFYFVINYYRNNLTFSFALILVFTLLCIFHPVFIFCVCFKIDRRCCDDVS